MGIKLIKKNESADGFSHIWELQAQQAKETLDEITKKFGDSDRLGFDIRKYSQRPECDVHVTVDGAPFITVEFEGGKTCNIRWHCFGDYVNSARLDMADGNASRNLILHYREDILDALESLYGFGAIADEGGQPQGSKHEKRVYPKFVQINTQKDFDRYIKPALGSGADAYGLSDIEGMWWEIADGERTPASAKTMREIRDNINKRPRFIFIHGVGAERGITDMSLTEYVSEMGMTTKEYLDGYDTGARESKKAKSTAKQEASTVDKWCVEFGDIYNNVKKEYYATEADAKARYDELAERGDIEWVEKPVIKAESKAEKLGYDDYAESVKTILMGREFEYGLETASQFVVDDYKDIVRKNYDAEKGALPAAADIDAAYMGKE
jgi:hypothetical protein